MSAAQERAGMRAEHQMCITHDAIATRDDDEQFVSLYSSFTHTQGTAQAAELQHKYFSLVVQRDVKQHFTVVGQAQFDCFMPQ